MPFFRRASDEDRAARASADAEQAASLAALERGELPLRAQQRLGETGNAAAKPNGTAKPNAGITRPLSSRSSLPSRLSRTSPRLSTHGALPGLTP